MKRILNDRLECTVEELLFLWLRVGLASRGSVVEGYPGCLGAGAARYEGSAGLSRGIGKDLKHPAADELMLLESATVQVVLSLPHALDYGIAEPGECFFKGSAGHVPVVYQPPQDQGRPQPP